MRLVIDADDVTAFIARMKNWPIHFHTVQVSALNEFGQTVLRQLVQLIAEDTGLAYAAASKYVSYTPATIANRTFTIRVKEGVLEDDARSDRIPARKFEEREQGATGDDQLFNVVTAKDHTVCDICDRISKEGPYSLAQLRGLKGHHPHFLSRELNCRCETTPFKPVRRIPVRMEGGPRGVKLDTSQTARQLAQRIRKDTLGVIRMK
jgi:hypothetical protein